MSARPLAVLVAVMLLPACGGSGVRSAADVRSCVAKRVPASARGHARVSTVEGVTTIDYVHGGDETVVTVFPTVKDAQHAMVEEARMGDAHDQRTANVLHSGGGAVEAAVVACLH